MPDRNDLLQDWSTGSPEGAACGIGGECPPFVVDPALLPDAPLIVPALEALVASLRESTGAASAAVSVFDGQNRWVTVAAGPAVVADGIELSSILRAGCEGRVDQPLTLADPARLAALCEGMLSVDGQLLSRLDLLCVPGEGGEVHGALCLMDVGPVTSESDRHRLLRGTASVVMRLLALHDRMEDYQHAVMLSPHMACAAAADGTILEIGAPLSVILGVDAKADLTAQFHARVHPEDHQVVAAAWSRALAGETPVEVEYRLLVLDRGYRWFRSHAKPRRDASGRITRWCGLLEDIHDRRTEQAKLAQLAYRDALTGLWNRTYFRLVLDGRLAPSSHGRPFALVRLELDDFRAITDTFGHAIGDRILLEAANRIEGCLQSSDLLAHGGGNEFLLLLDGIERSDAVVPVADDICRALRAPIRVDGSMVIASATIGVTLHSDDGMGPDKLMQNADLALLRAKSAGRGKYCFFSKEMDEKVRRRQALKVDLTHALDQQQFFLVYQPVLEAATGHVRGLESLLRWNHPTRGLVSPADFIPEAESSGLIVPIGGWVLEQACRDAAGWPVPAYVGVNLSAAQFQYQGLVGTVARALDASGLDPSRLVLEITESVPLLGENDYLAVLHALRALGVQIALDDFGTGYASLAYLQCFSFDMIKIERSFVARMMDGVAARTILQSVIRLSRLLGSVSVAEGVETVEQLDYLREEGCEAVQGYLFSRPVDGVQVAEVVATLTERARAASRAGQGEPVC